MNEEKLFERILWFIVILLNGIAIITKAYEHASLAFIVANLMFVIFVIVPKIKNIISIKQKKKKLNYSEGEIYDILECAEMFVFHYTGNENKVSETKSPELRAYPVIRFSDEENKNQVIIANEMDPGEYKVSDLVKIWYKKGKKERIQYKENIFLDKSYDEIIVIDNKLKKIDNDLKEKIILLFSHRNGKSLKNYDNTYIQHGKNLLIEKSSLGIIFK